MKRTKVVIVGAGFAGLNAAKGFANREGFDVLLLDRRNHHLFQPLLYQVAMAGLSPAEIAIPIRAVLRKAKNITVLLAAVDGIDLKNKRVHAGNTEFVYDYLILACGAEHSYFSHPEWEDFAPGLKTVEQATEIRRRVLSAFEAAETSIYGAESADPWLTFIVVGGGPTGVELAGALGELTRHTLARDFRQINPKRTRILLVEAGPRILAAFPEDLASRAKRDLEEMGVEVLTQTLVDEISTEGAKLGDKFVASKTVIWAAGVKPSPLNQMLGAPTDKAGRVIVTEELTLPNDPAVFVLGDQNLAKDDKDRPLPGLAPVAMQQGRYVARQIRREALGLERAPFRYLDKGQMATIGRRRAIVNTGKVHIGGLLAWLIWLFIHIFYLIGFRNRAAVLWNWTYNYLTYRRGARLITERDWRLKTSP